MKAQHWTFSMFFNYLKEQRTSITLGILITLLVLALQMFGQGTATLQRINGLIYDIRLKSAIQPRPEVLTTILIVDLDERSMQTEGRWPWSRFKIGKLIEKMADDNAAIIALDIMFSEPEPNPVESVVKLLKQNEVDESLLETVSQYTEQADADIAFSESIQIVDTVISMLFNDTDEIKAGSLPPTSIVFDTDDLSAVASRQYYGHVSNIELFNQTAKGIGFLNADPASDGFIRSTSLFANYQNKFYPSLALEAVRLYTLAPEVEVQTANIKGFRTVTGVKLNDLFIPTSATGSVLVPYKGPARSYRYISATDVLNDRLPEGTFDSAIVFVGTSAVGNADLRATPVGVQYPGVEVHANVVEALLYPEYLPSEPDVMEATLWFLLIFLGLLLSTLLPSLGPRAIAIFGFAILAGLISFDYYMWAVQKVSLSLATPLLLCFTLTVVNIAMGFFTESGKRKQIKGIFDQYVPPAHIDKMLQNPESLNTAGERKEMSVLFSDIRSFTTISEKLSAADLANLLNRYFSPITQAIFEHQGTIDKYVGDMVMAFWNAPLNDEDHAEHSIQCAFKMLEITEELTKQFVAEGWPAIRIGVGINTGEMNVGDMGSEYRRAYTVLGDAVNLGSRLEGLTKFYGVDLLVSEFTVAKCPKLTFRPIDKVRVKGKDTAVSILEPVHPDLANDKATLDEIAQYHDAYDDYLAQSWSKAEQKFQALLAHNPNRKVYSIYLERIEILKEHPPGEDWDGSFTHTSK